MKFTDGHWLRREGVQVLHPRQAYRVEATADSLTVLAPTRRIVDRGDTVSAPTLTVECSSPLADVISVKLIHHAGERPREPHFPLAADRAPEAHATAGETTAELSSGRLTVRISRGDEWRVEFLGDGRLLTASEPGATGIVEWHGKHYIREQLSLGVGERVYGLGERFGPFVKNGQSIEIWNKDGGTGSEQAYKNVPFYLTDRGYGVFVNDPGPVSFEVASERIDRVQFSIESQSLEYLVIFGPSPKEVLEKYTALTGRPALPPAWSFGLWLSTSFTTSYDEKTVTSLVEGMAEREIPLSVFHFDAFWMRDFRWCDFRWDERAFPDPEGMLARLHKRGLHVCVWINPYIAQASPLFAEAATAGYLLRKPNGDVWQTDQWQAGMAIVDFTSPDAAGWYARQLSRLLDGGVDCFKTDFGERIPTDVVWHDRSDPERMHNAYPLLYTRTVFELLRQKRGEGEALVFARSATAGCQQYPVHWGGDCESSFESMAASLRGGLSLGLAGFGFWSHDIGGFEGKPAPVLYHRWAAFGLLSSHSRLHGSSSHRVPWMVDEEAVDVVAAFARLKCRLMPYLYGAAVEASQRGMPVMRAMLLEFPDDPTCGFLDRQYMLGGSLLVAPVMDEDGEVTFYLPAGRWTHYPTGRYVDGPGWISERHDVMSLPLLVRPGSLLAVGKHEDRPDYDFADGVELRLYELADGGQARADIPDLHGRAEAVFEATRRGGSIVVERDGSKPWRLLLVNVRSVGSIVGGLAQAVDDGTLVIPNEGSGRLEIALGD